MPLTLVFVRHAEGTHNVNKEYANPVHMDALLTEIGHHQTATAQKPAKPFDAIYCSPMKRCIQTLLGLYPESKDQRVFVDDRLIEQAQGFNICNKRVEKQDMNIPPLWLTEGVSEINPFTLDAAADEKRIESFTNHVKNNHPDGCILVVSHCTFIHNWFKKYKSVDDMWLNNCEFKEAVL